MPRCISSTSPDARSAIRYFARRPSPVTVCPSSRATKSFWNGNRKSLRRASALTIFAPSITGCRPRRTVSTSGNSGMASSAGPFREFDMIVEGVGDGHRGSAPGLFDQAGPRVAVLLGQQFGVIGGEPRHLDRDLGAG